MSKSSPHFGAPYSKEDILQSMSRPSSETWMGLATSMWIRQALKDLPEEGSSRAEMQRLLEESERFSPKVPNSEAAYNLTRKDSCVDDDVATKGMCEPAQDHASLSRDVSSAQTKHAALLTIPSHHPNKNSVDDDLDETAMFKFDLRGTTGCHEFKLWMDEAPDWLNPVRSIEFLHQTWIYTEDTATWSAINDRSTFSLLSDGRIQIRRHESLSEGEKCHCDDEPEQDDDETNYKVPYTVADFARSIAQDDSELLRCASEFVVSREWDGQKYEAILCEKCRMSLFYVRSSREREIKQVPAPMACLPSEPPQIPPKSSVRGSRKFSWSNSETLHFEQPLDHQPGSPTPSTHDDTWLVPLKTSNDTWLLPLEVAFPSPITTPVTSSPSLASPQTVPHSIPYEALPAPPSNIPEEKPISEDVTASPSPQGRKSLKKSERTLANRLSKGLSMKFSSRNSGGRGSDGLNDEEGEPVPARVSKRNSGMSFASFASSARTSGSKRSIGAKFLAGLTGSKTPA